MLDGGSPRIRAVNSEGELKRIPTPGRRLIETTWTGGGVLQLHEPGSWALVTLFWESDGAFEAWYLDLCTPLVRTHQGFDYSDMTLDVIIWADGSVEWKVQVGVAAELGVPIAQAKRWVDTARRLRKLPHLSASFESGCVSFEKIEQVSRVATPETDESLAEAAPTMNSAQIRKLANKLESAKDPNPAHAARYLRYRWSHDGSEFKFSGQLPGDAGDIFAKAIEREMDTMPKVPEEERPSYSQQAADALVNLASANIAEDPDADRATVVVHTDASVLTHNEGIAESEFGTILHPDIVRRLACDCRLQITAHDSSGRTIGVDRTMRTVPPWLMGLEASEGRHGPSDVGPRMPKYEEKGSLLRVPRMHQPAIHRRSPRAVLDRERAHQHRQPVVAMPLSPQTRSRRQMEDGADRSQYRRDEVVQARRLVVYGCPTTARRRDQKEILRPSGHRLNQAPRLLKRLEVFPGVYVSGRVRVELDRQDTFGGIEESPRSGIPTHGAEDLKCLTCDDDRMSRNAAVDGASHLRSRRPERADDLFDRSAIDARLVPHEQCRRAGIRMDAPQSQTEGGGLAVGVIGVHDNAGPLGKIERGFDVRRGVAEDDDDLGEPT